MSQTNLKGKWALVTGASSGLGADFARDLAGRGANLVLTARREELLSKLRDEIHTCHDGEVDVVPLDLQEPGGRRALFEETERRKRPISVLVNNAGFGIFGEFLKVPWEREEAMLQLDILALVELTKLYARPMVSRKEGWILQVSSIGAYQPTPTYATYSAAKAFVLSFGEALNHELRGTGVGCTVISPGVTETEFLKVAGQSATAYQRLVMMKSPEVVRIGVEAMLARRSSVVPGFVNAATAWSNRLVPRSLSTALAHRLMS